MAQDPEQLEALLAEYVEGTLDDAGVRTVESHLATNPAARALIEEMRGDRAAFAKMPRLTVPGDLSEDLRGQLERDLLLNDKSAGGMKIRRFSPSIAAIAAMLFVGLGLTGVAYVLLADRPKQFMDVAFKDPAAETTATTAPSKGGRLDAMKRVGAPDARIADEPLSKVGPANESAFSREAAPSANADRDRALPSDATPSEKIEAAKASVAGDSSLPAASSVAAGGAAETRADVAAPMASIAPQAEAIAAPVPAIAVAIVPALEISDAVPPDDVSAALVGRSFDLSRRSVVIVVDQRDALDALATVSHAARVAGTPLEVSDRAAQLALPGSANILQQSNSSNAQLNRDDRGSFQQGMLSEPAAEVAVVARGLTTMATASLQSDLKKMQPAIESGAFDVPAALVEPQSNRVPTTAPAATQPAQRQMRTTAEIIMGATAARNAAPASPATSPTTRAASAPINVGEHLRITLTDPDAFDLRTQHEVVVDAGGGIVLPSLKNVHAAGDSIDTLRISIADAYKSANLMRHPIVRVESIDSGAASKELPDAAKLLDVYVVVRKPLLVVAQPTTEPAAAEPIVEPTTAPTTQP